MNYSHVICGKCFGIVEFCYGELVFRCLKCGRKLPLRGSDYDILMIDENTGQIFPMLKNKHLRDQTYEEKERKIVWQKGNTLR